MGSHIGSGTAESIKDPSIASQLQHASDTGRLTPWEDSPMPSHVVVTLRRNPPSQVLLLCTSLQDSSAVVIFRNHRVYANYFAVTTSCCVAGGARKVAPAARPARRRGCSAPLRQSGRSASEAACLLGHPIQAADSRSGRAEVLSVEGARRNREAGLGPNTAEHGGRFISTLMELSRSCISVLLRRLLLSGACSGAHRDARA